jgi:hypothetical protein
LMNAIGSSFDAKDMGWICWRGSVLSRSF